MPSYILESYTITEYYNFINTNSKYINKDHITINEFNDFIEYYMSKMLYTTDYKNITNFSHLNLIADIIINSGFDKNQILYNNYILKVSQTMKGQLILYKLISYLDIIDIKNLIKDISCKWTFPIFLFYMNYLKNIKYKLTRQEIDYIIITSFQNTDDRIYKYIIDNNYFNIITLDYEIVSECIKSIYKSNSPPNYLLKKFKYLNRIYSNLFIHINEIVDLFISNNLQIIPTLFKYYYKKSSLINDENIIRISHNLGLYNASFIYKTIYDYLNTSYEKNFFFILTLFNYGNIFDTYLIIDESLLKLSEIIKENIYKISYNLIINNNTLSNIFNNNYISDFIIIDKNTPSTFIWTIIPFFIAKNGELACKYNLIRYTISKYIKRIKKINNFTKKIIEYKNNKLKEPNKMNFKIPPTLVYPNQLYNYNNKALLKEKPDGILVYELPNNIFPFVKFNYEIKAEYIEELDLYLVFDIDYNNNCIDRHKYIHSFHEFGQIEIPLMTCENMIELINIERIKLKEFLKLPYSNYRWYPKPAWLINVKNMIKPLIDIINMDLIIEDNINNISYDGFILSPLNDNEVKIKPKKFYTIDLLYKNNKFYDRDNHVWDIKLINNELINNELINNSIYRCYPENNNWVAKEIRYDKLKPNTNMIVNNIINLYNTKYELTCDNYYEKKNNSNEWNKIINDNKNIIKILINKYNKMKHTVLDLGCGYNRVLPYINYDYYVGIDINNNNNKPNVLNLIYDLNNGIKISFFKKFNLITCINSIMHFSTDVFWSDLNKIVNKNAIMIINVLDMDNIRYEQNDYFIERDNEYVIYKFPIHNKIKQEKYIDIEEKFNNYGWKIIDIFKPTNDNLTKLYKWYVVVKNE